VYEGREIVINAYLLWCRLREILAGFITGIDATIARANKEPFSITGFPAIGSILPSQRSKNGHH
jgi:hypothetical protein